MNGGIVHVLGCDEGDAGVDAFLHRFALEMIDDGFDAEVTHGDGVLDDEPLDIACFEVCDGLCAGVEPDPAETSSELTQRVVSSLGLESRAVAELAELYREARFSIHDLDEGHRSRAIALLQDIGADLRRRVPSGSAEGQP